MDPYTGIYGTYTIAGFYIYAPDMERGLEVGEYR